MTKNQIEYMKALETRRANLASEQLTRTRDQAAISARQAELVELARHNKAGEGLQARSIDETSRHNRAGEAVSIRQAAVSERDVSTRERQAAVAERQAATAERQASVAEAKLGQEAAKIAETERTNRTQEWLRAQEIDLRARTLDETHRTNVVHEGIAAYDAESRREQAHAATAQAAASQQQAEASMIHMANEALKNDRDYSQREHQLDLEEQRVATEIGRLGAYSRSVDVSMFDSGTKSREADTHQYQAQTGRAGLIVDILGGVLRGATNVAGMLAKSGG